MASRATVTGLQEIIVNMEKGNVLRVNAVMAAMQIVNDKAFEMVKADCNLDDHTLKQLAAMGHPYAVRGDYSNIKSKRTITRQPAPHPDNLVHKQSNLLYDNVGKEVKLNGKIITSRVFVDSAKVFYVKYLIYGTDKMQPRDFFANARQYLRTDGYKELIRRIKAGN